MAKKIIDAKTFTTNYVEREDRVLLTLNYEDPTNRIDFWITRAFLLKLLPYLFDYMLEEQPTAPTQEASQPQTTPTDAATFSLTLKDPLLLDSIDISPQKDGTIHFVMKSLEKEIYAVAKLDRGLFDKVIRLIIGAAPAFSWGIHLK